MGFCNGHTHRVSEALSEWASGHFDAGSVADFRVARSRRIPLAELLEIVDLESVTGQVEQRVLKDRCVSIRQDESVAVGPRGVCRIMTHDTREQHMSEWGESHCGALMTALGMQRGIHREPADDVDCLPV